MQVVHVHIVHELFETLGSLTLRLDQNLRMPVSKPLVKIAVDCKLVAHEERVFHQAWHALAQSED